MKTCYCKDIEVIDTKLKFIILMHPREAYKQKTGTGRLTSLSLKDSEIIIGQSFETNKAVNTYIADPDYMCMMLYPGEDAVCAASLIFCEELQRRKLAVFIIDATWSLAGKMVSRSPNLQALPRISFSRNYRSRFSIKTQPASYCLSTIESVYYLINELQQAGVCDDNIQTSGLMKVFLKMNQFQIDCQKARKTADQ